MSDDLNFDGRPNAARPEQAALPLPTASVTNCFRYKLLPPVSAREDTEERDGRDIAEEPCECVREPCRDQHDKAGGGGGTLEPAVLGVREEVPAILGRWWLRLVPARSTEQVPAVVRRPQSSVNFGQSTLGGRHISPPAVSSAYGWGCKMSRVCSQCGSQNAERMSSSVASVLKRR